MHDKTISYLNTQWWYRLLKVVMITAFFLGSITTTLLIYSDEKPDKIIDNEKTTISCYGSTFTAKEFDLNFYRYINDNFIYWAKINCKEREYKKNPDKYPEQISGYKSIFGFGVDDPKYKVPNDNNFKIEDHYKMSDTYFKVVFDITIWWIILYIIFEIIRRSFYYIILGTIKPKK